MGGCIFANLPAVRSCGQDRSVAVTESHQATAPVSFGILGCPALWSFPSVSWIVCF